MNVEERKVVSRNAAKAALVSAIVVAAGCAAPTATRGSISASEQLDAYLAQCTARHGYDPETASNLGPYVLGAGEHEWRECVYQAIEKYMVPTTPTPEIYRRAIAEDRKMTEAVASGQMTRAQRRARVQELLAEIERVEEQNRAKLAQAESLNRLVQEDLQRQQRMMLYRLAPLTH
jgi:hypothetical protein